jgi:hypothetical protein
LKYTDYINNNFEYINQTKYFDLEIENIKIFVKIISDILNIDPAFNDAFYNDYIYTNEAANRKAFINFIKKTIYWKKAIKRYIIQCIGLMAYFVIRIILFNLEYCCKEELIPNSTIIIDSSSATHDVNFINDTDYWNCVKGKCIVTNNNYNITKIIRIIYYIFYYILFLVYKGIYLKTFCVKIKRLQTTRNIYIYKSFEYILLLALVILDYIDNTKCYKSQTNEHLFFKIKEFKLNLPISILDIILEITIK